MLLPATSLLLAFLHNLRVLVLIEIMQVHPLVVDITNYMVLTAITTIEMYSTKRLVCVMRTTDVAARLPKYDLT